MVADGTGNPLLSVIIPVHNGATHLRECLDSVLAQTLDSLEVIVVDDGSTDETPEILRHYALRSDGRLRVLTQSSNQGVSTARNRGIGAAAGKYIAFVDADDRVRPSMYRHMVQVAEAQDLDMISCGIQLFNDKGVASRPISYPLHPRVLMDTQDVRIALETGFTSKLLWFPVRSLYRRRLILDNAVRFDSQIRKGEDSLFNLEILGRVQRCASVEEAYYLYRKHDASVTARPLANERENLDRLSDRVTMFFHEDGYPQRAVDDFYRYVLGSDLPNALVRLAGQRGACGQLRRLKSSQHVKKALTYLSTMKPQLSLRVWMLLLLFKVAPSGTTCLVLSVAQKVRRAGAALLRRTG